MAIDPLKMAAEARDDANSLFPAVAGLFPLGVVGYAAYRGGKRNQPITASSIIGTTGNLGDLGRTIGQKLQEEVGLETLTEDFMKKDYYKELVNQTQQRNAVIQSLLSTLSDPSAGLDPQQLLSFRDQLMELADNATPDEEARKILKSALQTISESGSEPLQRRFASRVREYSKVSQHLVAPKFEFKSGAAFSVVEHGNMQHSGFRKGLFNGSGEWANTQAGKLGGRYDRLMKMLGPGAQQRVELMVADSGGGERGVYARVWSGKGVGQGRWATTINLAAGLTQGDTGQIVRLGKNLPTAYGAPRYVADSRTALNVLNRNPALAGDFSGFRQAAGVRTFQDWQLDLLEEELQAGNRTIRNPTEFNARMRDLLEVAPRGITTSDPSIDQVFPGYRRNIKSQFLGAHRTVAFTRMERLAPEEKTRLLTSASGSRMAGVNVMDPGVGAGRILSNYIEGRQYGLLQLTRGSILESFRTGISGGANRLSTPVVARLEQVANRQNFWIRGNSQKGVSRTMGKGGLFRAGAEEAAIGFGRGAPVGGLNQAVLMDVTMGGGRGAYAATEGWGQMYTRGDVGKMLNQSVIPILDPKDNRVLSTKLLETLQEAEAQQRGLLKFDIVRDKSGTRLKLGDTFFDTLLGEGTAGARKLHIDPRAQHVWLGIGERIEAAGKKEMKVLALNERNMDMAKVFGVLHKGTVVGVDTNTIERDLATYGIDRTFLKNLNISLDDLFVGSGDMLKKAPDFLSHQMITGMGLVTKGLGGDPFGYVQKYTDKYKSGTGFGGGSTGKVADVVMRRLSKGVKSGKVSVEEAGRVLSGLYYGSGMAKAHGVKNAPGAFYGDYDAKNPTRNPFAFQVEKLEARMKSLFGDSSYGKMLGIMKQGAALGAGTFVPGTGHGDYKLGRGSIEPRFVEFMGRRLMDMGLNRNEIGSFMTSILKRKMGVQDALGLVSPLENMVASQINMLKGRPDAATLNMDQFRAVLSKHGTFSKYLETQQGGVYLDLASGKGTSGAAIAHAARQKFGSANPLYFAGGGAMSHMRGTQIKQGENILDVGPRYAGVVDSFANNLLQMTNGVERYEGQAGEVFQLFKKETARLYSSALFNLSKGKIKGSAMTMLQGYSLYSDDKLKRVGIGKERFKAVRSLTMGSHGQALFMDDNGFLSMLKDYKGKDKGRLLSMFYTSSETALERARAGTEVGKLPGILSPVMRNPLLGYGNVNVGSIYRDIQQVGQAQGDRVFSWLQRVDGQAVADLETTLSKASKSKVRIGGFGDVAKLDQKNAAVKKFWNTMAGHLRKWEGEGGGATYMPDMKFTVHFGVPEALSASTDFGMAGAMLGDMDGDNVNTILLDKTQRLKLLSTMSEKSSREAYLEANAQYIAQSSAYTKYGKEALKKKMIENGVAPDLAAREIQKIHNELQNEMASKRITGPLDVELNNIRRAVLSMKDADSNVVRETLAMLKVLEEHTTIKGKKLPIHEPLGEYTVDAVQRMIKEGSVAPFKHLLQEVIFPKRHFPELYEGFEMSVSAAGQKVDFVKGAHGARVNLTNVIDLIGEAMPRFVRAGGTDAATANMLASRLASENLTDASRVFNLTIAGDMGLQAGMATKMGRDMVQQAAGSMGGTYQQVVAAAGKLDRRLAAGAALGLGAGAAILGFAGVDGYDSTPLMMPGETPASYVSEAASSYNLLESTSRSMAPQAASDPYDINSKPLHMGSAIVPRDTAYSIRGEGGNMAGIDQLGGYLHSLTGGRGVGSILINDTRRPLSSAYIDRAMGEY